MRLLPALVGGTFAGLAWHSVAYLFARLVTGSSEYSAVYSGMAAAVLFIIWLNVGWLIVLVGAHIARYTQHPHLLRQHLDGAKIGQVHDPVLTLEIMTAIGRAHYFDEPEWTLETLTAGGCRSSPDQVEQLLRSLREEGLMWRPTTNPRPISPPA